MRRLSLVLLLASCRAESGASTAPEPATPSASDPVVTETETNIAPRPFTAEGVAAALAYSAEAGGHAVLILHAGEPVALEFQGGWDTDRPHPLASGTKSFWGPLAVAAVEDGLLASLDEPASKTLHEWADDPRKQSITIRQLLSFTSGLNPDLGVSMETVPDSDMFALAVAADAVEAPGSKWAYSDSAHTAVGVVLDRKLQERGSTLEQYLKERLLTPLGIEVGPWQRDAAQHLLMPSGARLVPEQWAAFGEMVRLQGKTASGEVVLPAEPLQACFQPTQAPPAGQFYGLGWWLTSYSAYKYALPRMHIAGGTGGQMLAVIPESEVTVVRFGSGDSFADGEFFCRLFHGVDTTSCPVRE